MTYADMLKFCGVHDEARPQIQTPWTANGKYYATNGRIGIALDYKPDGWVDVEAGKRPDLQWVINDATNRVKPPRTGWEKPYQQEFSPCDWCARSGKITCPHCKGELTDCEGCEGTGKIEKQILVRCYGGVFDNQYLAMVSPLPGLTVCEGNDELCPMMFHFDGGRGALMPMRDFQTKNEIRQPLGVKA